MCGVPIADGSPFVWTKRNETLWNFLLKNFFGRAYSLRLTTGNSANRPAIFLINWGRWGRALNLSSQCLLFNAQQRVPSNILNLFSDTTGIHSYCSRSSPSNNFYIKKYRLDIQKRAFSRVGGKIWNEIPALLREQLLPKDASKRNSTLSFLISKWNLMTILIFPKLPPLWKRKIELLKVTSFKRT